MARFVIAATRPARMVGFAHASRALVLNFMMSPTVGTATDRLKRPAPCCLDILAAGISGVSSATERCLSASSNPSSGKSRCTAGTTRWKAGWITRLDVAAVVVPPVEMEIRSSEPLKSEKYGMAVNSAPLAVPCTQNSDAADPDNCATCPTARLKDCEPGPHGGGRTTTVPVF